MSEIKIDIDSQQTFKSGIRDLVATALEQGGSIDLRNCVLTMKDGTAVKFQINVTVTEIQR